MQALRNPGWIQHHHLMLMISYTGFTWVFRNLCTNLGGSVRPNALFVVTP
jgi:hypothetical protein